MSFAMRENYPEKPPERFRLEFATLTKTHIMESLETILPILGVLHIVVSVILVFALLSWNRKNLTQAKINEMTIEQMKAEQETPD